MKYISVPQSYAIYEVEDEVIPYLNASIAMQPPQLVLELLAINGKIKRVGTVGAVTLDASEFPTEEEGEEGEEGNESPWVEDND